MARESKTQIFRGTSYTEALLKAKREFGNDFSIVTRRDVREANLFSKLTSGKLGGDNLAVELEVAVGPLEPRKTEKKPLGPGEHPLLRSYAKAMEGAEKHAPAVKQAMTAAAAPFVSVGETATGIAGRLDEFQRELQKSSRENADLRDELRMLISLQARGGVPAVTPQLLDCYRRLTANGVAEAMARDIVEGMQKDNPALCDPSDVEAALLQAVARRLPAAGPLLLAETGPTVVALIGASGVGKTTSVAKLAIHFTMNMRKSVGLINEDRRRPGAESQINNLNRIFGIPVSTATEPEEMRDVVKSMAGRDLIILDTGGRSPRDAAGIRRLAEITEAVGAHETHLLLSGVHSEKTMRESLARFRPTGFNRVILTKLDECLSFGGVLNVGAELSEGLSYVTSGPDYTKPIEPADASVLAELVLGFRQIEAGGDGAGEVTPR